MLTPTTSYYRSLGNGLALKSICDMRDVERLNVFDKQIFGEGVGDFAQSLLLHHPSTRPDDWLYIEDETNGQVVSCLCLIPWTWRYEDITLKCGEVGVVATHNDYRHRGLVRAQIARHRELLREGEYDLSHIQGIPYFYRQFGYEYALPLEAHLNLELRSIPTKETSLYNFRLATRDDQPVLMRLYDEAAQQLNVSAVRDQAVWDYLLQHTVGTDTEAETWLILDNNDQPLGYYRVTLHGFGEGLVINEASRLGYDVANDVLCHLKQVAQDRNKPYIRLSLPASSDLAHAAHHLNAHDDGCYAWQIHLVDVARVLRKLAPVLERRLAASALAGFSRTVYLNLYHEAFALQFEQGKLNAVNSIGFSDKADIRIPPLLLAPLLLGYRSRDELSRMYPDFSARGENQYLVEVLFPKMEGFIFSIY